LRLGWFDVGQAERRFSAMTSTSSHYSLLGTLGM